MHRLADKLFHHHAAEKTSEHDEQGNAVHQHKSHDTIKQSPIKSDHIDTKGHSFSTSVDSKPKLHNPTISKLSEVETEKRVDTPIPSHKVVDAHVEAHQHHQVETLIHSHSGSDIQTVVRPTIVDETHRPEEIVEIQPVIHRYIETREVRHIERHIYETVPSVGPSTVTMQPIIQETIQPVIVEEISTIIHREVPETQVIRKEEHLTEHVVKPTVYTKQVVDDATERINNINLSSLEKETTLVQPSVRTTKFSGGLKSSRLWKEAHPLGLDTPTHRMISSARGNIGDFAELPPNVSSWEMKRQEVYEPTSLDVRAQLSLERLADLQAMNSGMPSISSTPTPHFTSTGDETLEKGSTIGLQGTRALAPKEEIEKQFRKEERKEDARHNKPATANPLLE